MQLIIESVRERERERERYGMKNVIISRPETYLRRRGGRGGLLFLIYFTVRQHS